MPGNKAVFQDAIKKAHNAAWDGNWAKAIAEYRRASTEFPQDSTVHLSLAHAMDKSGQLEAALHECRIASKLSPHDPEPLAHIADLEEKLGQLGEAAGTYLQLADMHVANKAMGKAVEAWQRASALEPERTDVHQKLADVYEQGAHHSLASKEFLALARIYLKRNDKPKATSAVRQALKLDARNAEARSLCEELERGDTPPPEPAPSPVDKAQKTALSRLAETLLEERPGWARTNPVDDKARTDGTMPLSQAEVDALIAQAVDAQTQRRVNDAIEAYRRLVSAGVTRPEVKFNLGLLYFETMRYDEAAQLLNETVGDSTFSLASHFALGQCYRAQGKVDAALEHFIQVTKIVDLQSVRRDQADELISVYEGLAESYAAKGDREQAESFSRALEEFLTSKGWEDKVRDVRRHLEALHEEGGQVSLAEVIEVPESDKVLESLAVSQEYLRRGKFYAASEECLRAIELAPVYLPAHMRLAEVLAKAGRTEEAHAKYQTLAEVASARGDWVRAENFYRQLLKMSPDDVGSRSRLIDLLVKQGRTETALQAYVELGDVHMRAEQFDKAAEKFGEGIRFAVRAGLAAPLVLNLRHRLAEARARQRDFKGALAAYQEIRQQSPDDERAFVFVIDLEWRLGQSAQALRDLDELLTRYRTRGEPRKAVGVLEGLVQSFPNEAAPRVRLAQWHINNGDTARAVTVLDALGELQLGAGQKQAAAATLRQIISLNPPHVEEYKQLLKQIGE